MKTVFDTLEFNLIQEQIAKYAKTELGRDFVFNISLFQDSFSLQEELSIVNEMMSFISRYGTLPINNSIDLIKKIDLAKKGGILSINDLEQVAADVLTSLKIKKYFLPYKAEYLILNAQIEKLVNLKGIEESIHRVISPSLTIYDDASRRLYEIRSSIRRIEQDIKRRMLKLLDEYETILTDKTITMRNGHFVLPIKSGDKNKVVGIIHDVSDTGQTTFIEPSDVVELNNRLYMLKQDEHDEIMQILRQLTNLVVTKESDIVFNNRLIGYLDFVTSKSIYGNENEGSIASISSSNLLDIRNVRHPLIDRSISVNNDFHLDERQHILLISGPNAGGKSVALKTVGLAVVMHMSGLPILANEGGVIPFFKRIYIDIGDQQSLSDSLSTFSAHLENLVKMTTHLGSKDLVIFDELGTGTDPLEGEALAKSTLDFLHYRRAMSLITSHFSGVKTYGIEHDFVSSGSMVFNEETMTPTYRMQIGLPGKSYGLEVASRLGLSKFIVDKAISYLKNSSNDSSRIIENLHHIVNENEKLKKELLDEKNNIKNKEIQLSKLQASLNKQKEHLLEDAKVEREELIEDTKKKIDEIMNSLKKDNLKLHEVIAAKRAIDEQEDNDDIVSVITNESIKVNDLVHIDSLDIDGTVLRVNKERVLVSTIRGKFEVNISSLSKSTIIKSKEKESKSFYQVDDMVLSKRVPLELNIIGMHAEEALTTLEEYIDSVIVKNYKQVRIIHGSGTGVLRKVVHEYLSKVKEIDSYRLGGLNEGGVGATVVYFK